MKKVLNPSHSFLDFGYDGCEDGDEFVGFLDERFCLLVRKNTAPHKQVKPKIGFIQFLQDGLEFVDDIRVRFCAIPFTIICTDRCSRTKGLFPENLRFG